VEEPRDRGLRPVLGKVDQEGLRAELQPDDRRRPSHAAVSGARSRQGRGQDRGAGRGGLGQEAGARGRGVKEVAVVGLLPYPVDTNHAYPVHTLLHLDRDLNVVMSAGVCFGSLSRGRLHKMGTGRVDSKARVCWSFVDHMGRADSTWDRRIVAQGRGRYLLGSRVWTRLVFGREMVLRGVNRISMIQTTKSTGDEQ